MSHAAFLAAIREQPDADLPRLVFADWLEEQGEVARAEFIRVQCELAALPDHDPRFRELEDREHELLSEHEPAWAGELPKYATEWEWRRGFVDEVTLRLEDRSRWDDAVGSHPVTGLTLECPGDFEYAWAMELEQFGSLSSIQRVDVSHVTRRGFDDFEHFGLNRRGHLGEAVTEQLARQMNLTKVQEWNLAGAFRLEWIDELLAVSPHTPRMTRLSLSDPRWAYRVESAEDGRLVPPRVNAALNDTQLRSLSLHDCNLLGDELRELLTASWAESLTHLDISGNPLAPDAYRAFADARPRMRLQSLDVSGTPLAGISLEPLLATRACEALTKLEMNGCGSARRNMEVLSRSRFWTQATELRAHSGTIPASTLEPLCGSDGPPGLRLLDLADNYLRTEGVRLLCEAPWNEQLTWLALSRNYLDDDSCRVLANSRLRHLRTLHLAQNNLTQDRSDGEVITDIGVSWLTDSPTLANLRLLTLSYTSISDRSVGLVMNLAAWRLFGLGIAGNNLTPYSALVLANSPRLARLTWLDISGNPRLGGRALLPLAESPYLSRLCELDCGGIDMALEVRQAFRERLGPRFSE